jgi:hypothetical protein
MITERRWKFAEEDQVINRLIKCRETHRTYDYSLKYLTYLY